MKYFPIFADLKNKPVLLVGSGITAARKAYLLYEAGACIKIIGNNLCQELKKLLKKKNVSLISDVFEEKYVFEVFLVIAATNDNIINQNIFQAANKNMKLVNVVDDQSKCSFIFPSIVDRKTITIAISSDGKSPVLTKLIREKIEKLIPIYISFVAEIAGKWRNKVKKYINNINSRRKFWEELFNSSFIEEIASHNFISAEKILSDHLYNSKKISGELILVGSGPGNPELLTIRGLQVIQSADIVLYDHLVSKEILNLIRRDAQKIYVGKQAGQHTYSQKEINEKIINLVKLGNKVIRLKGGDSFIFGRGGEELEAAKNACIKFQVVPGITSAIGASAYSGIPLTHRDYSQSILFLTGHLQKNFDDKIKHYFNLYKENQTIVIYMGKLKAKEISEKLILNGFYKNTPVAIISNATKVNQKILIGNIKNMDQISKLLLRPAILIIGNIVNLHKKLKWFKTN